MAQSTILVLDNSGGDLFRLLLAYLDATLDILAKVLDFRSLAAIGGSNVTINGNADHNTVNKMRDVWREEMSSFINQFGQHVITHR